MPKLHIQFVMLEIEGTSGKLKERANLVKQLFSKVVVGEPREVDIPEKGKGWVIDVYITKGVETYREMFKEINRVGEVFAWCIE